jgi:hypothetical protein
MVTVPPDAPVTTPLLTCTDATDGLLLDHVPPGVAQFTVTVLPSQTGVPPVIAAGSGFTVTVA